MLNAKADKTLMAASLREFAEGRVAFEIVERVAVDIVTRWSGCPTSDLPRHSDAERPLWCAIWDITSSCRESLLDPSARDHPVLQHVAYLEGARPLTLGWTAMRP